MEVLKNFRSNTIEVEDKVTGFVGVVTGMSSYITGCDQYLVQPKVKAESKDFNEPRWFDEGRLKVISIDGQDYKPSDLIGKDNGPDVPAPVK
jgi:hypothetical protein